MSKLTTSSPKKGERTEGESVAIGEWYWVSFKDHKGRKGQWFGCVMEIGSNYVLLREPSKEREGYAEERIHFDVFNQRCTHEPAAETYIQAQQVSYQDKLARLIGKVNEVTNSLGVAPKQVESQVGDTTNALAVIVEQVDTSAYKQALVECKTETLPALFEEIEDTTREIARWMIAPTLPMKAGMTPQKVAIAAVEDRIYTIELYAGLSEDGVKIADGDAAMTDTPLHVYQRRRYMDEECLADYDAGGMDINSIDKFDEWIARPHNRDRILSHPRSLVAFRVRRMDKERECASIWQAFINAQLREADKWTFLYVRNGEQIWRITCDFEFDEKIVPDLTEFDPSQPMMVKMFANRIDKMITRNAWEVMRDEELVQYAKYEAWKEANPGKSWIENPHRNSVGFSFDHKSWRPFDAGNVYFDDVTRHIGEAVKRYNRVAIIIQGIFDRSLALHPHHPVKVWDPVSFDRSIKVVYDATTLTHGDPPDFEAYRAKLNASIGVGSLITGHRDLWLQDEARKINEKNRRNRYRESYRPPTYQRYEPHDDQGPGLVAEVTEMMPRKRRGVVRWIKPGSWRSDDRPRKFEAPLDGVLNVSAYEPGDYKRFLADPRTRMDYIEWAPLMLAAEDYHAGRIAAGQVPKKGHGTDW